MKHINSGVLMTYVESAFIEYNSLTEFKIKPIFIIKIKSIQTQTHKFGVLDIFVERCIFSKPIFKPESLAYIRIKDNSDRLSEVKFKGWMFASSPALNALENSVYDISILACKKVDKQLEKSSSVSPKERISTSN